MTMDERGKRWMAYMDGQMSASEALEFERSLSPEDKQRLDDEVRLEAAICDALHSGECCPVALWNNITTRMKKTGSRPSALVRWQRRFVALAASIAILITSSVIYREIFPGSNVNVASGLEITEDNVADFASHTEVPGTREATQRFLDDHHIGLRFVGAEEAQLDVHHPVRLLGACMGSCPSGSLIEVRLTCCDKPVKLIIAKEGSAGAQLIRRACRCGKVQASRVSNGIVTALVGDIHGHTALLDLLQPTSDNFV